MGCCMDSRYGKMSSAWGPWYLLFRDEPLADELVDRRFRNPRRYSFPAPMTPP